MRTLLWDLAVLAGAGAVLGGLWWIYPPVALIAGGLTIAGVGIRAACGRKPPGDNNRDR